MRIIFAILDRLYDALLMLYPAAFRAAYARDMRLTFHDACLEAARRHGMAGLIGLWLGTLLDLFPTALRQRAIAAMKPRTPAWAGSPAQNLIGVTAMTQKPSSLIGPNLAAAISLALCAPFAFMVITASLNITPDFARALTAPDGGPTAAGRIIMIAMVTSIPAAFVINLLPMFAKARVENVEPFRPDRAHTIAGLSILLAVLVVLSGLVRHELTPFVAPLGTAAVAGRFLFFAVISALPVLFLLNRFPRLAVTGREGGLIFAPSSINLIVGAAILLTVLMMISGIALEMTACSIGVPNCD